jgi:hypothetical protein
MTKTTLTNAYTGEPIYRMDVADELRIFGRELTNGERLGQRVYRRQLATDSTFASRESGIDVDAEEF